jgi:hypothetical protein
MAFFGGLKKMTITSFKNSSFTTKRNDVTVFINPAGYAHSYQIHYNNRQAQGSNGPSPDFNRMGAQTLKFELVFDGTGVVPPPLPGFDVFTEDGITKQVDTFISVVFAYDGNIHSPTFLKVNWGSLNFKCRLSTLDIRYTLFKPDGTPLRARATAAFIVFYDEKELARMATNNSPDLSHLVTVKGGDTLPLLCYEIYGSSTPYLEVARVNGLENFRNLVTGTQILFPPLQDSAA